jgi:hypothetical protein
LLHTCCLNHHHSFEECLGKNAEEVIYGSGGNEDQEGGDENRCAICNSRIDELDIVLAEVI